jgi:hypothetical protein
LGLTHKKAPNLVGMGLLACFVTSEVDKSNVYGDLERISNWRAIDNIERESE